MVVLEEVESYRHMVEVMETCIRMEVEVEVEVKEMGVGVTYKYKVEVGTCKHMGDICEHKEMVLGMEICNESKVIDGLHCENHDHHQH